jgi:hypothetical protein
MKALIKKKDLKKHETVVLYRLRRNETQEEFAEALGCTLDRVKRMEAGINKKDLAKFSDVLNGPITIQEQCIIKRRRARMTQNEVAKALKISRFWLIGMEHGKNNLLPLYNFWNERNRNKLSK